MARVPQAVNVNCRVVGAAVAAAVAALQVMAYEACRDVMESLRAKYSGPLQVQATLCQCIVVVIAAPTLFSDWWYIAWLGSLRIQALEQFMLEVGKRFVTRTEERLLAVVYTLQQRTYKTGLPSNAPVPEVFKKELAGEDPLPS